MARKVIPVSNTQNLTWVIIGILAIVVCYLWYRVSYLGNTQNPTGILPPNHSQHVSVTNALAKVAVVDINI